MIRPNWVFLAQGVYDLMLTPLPGQHGELISFVPKLKADYLLVQESSTAHQTLYYLAKHHRRVIVGILLIARLYLELINMKMCRILNDFISNQHIKPLVSSVMIKKQQKLI